MMGREKEVPWIEAMDWIEKRRDSWSGPSPHQLWLSRDKEDLALTDKTDKPRRSDRTSDPKRSQPIRIPSLLRDLSSSFRPFKRIHGLQEPEKHDETLRVPTGVILVIEEDEVCRLSDGSFHE